MSTCTITTRTTILKFYLLHTVQLPTFQTCFHWLHYLQHAWLGGIWMFMENVCIYRIVNQFHVSRESSWTKGQHHTTIHLGKAELVFHVIQYPDPASSLRPWRIIAISLCSSYLTGSVNLYYYRCNNYVARKVWFCVSAWTWRHRLSHLNCLITQGSELDWDDCLLFMFISFFW